MNAHPHPDLFEDGAALRDEGIQRAIDHADREHAGWAENAFANLLLWLQQRAGPFMLEDVRAFAQERGLPEPPDRRAWGAVVMRAARSGLIVAAGFGRSKNPKAHKRPTQIWKAARA